MSPAASFAGRRDDDGIVDQCFGPLCCTDRQPGEIGVALVGLDSNAPVGAKRAANVFRPPDLGDAVQRGDGNCHFCRVTPSRSGQSGVTCIATDPAPTKAGINSAVSSPMRSELIRRVNSPASRGAEILPRVHSVSLRLGTAASGSATNMLSNPLSWKHCELRFCYTWLRRSRRRCLKENNRVDHSRPGLS